VTKSFISAGGIHVAGIFQILKHLKMLNKSLLSALLLVAFQCVSTAQQFDYVFSQRIEAYENLEQSVPISGPNYWYSEAWNIPIGFEFNFFEYPFDSVTVYCASSLYFGYADYQEALLFAGFSQAIIDRGILGPGNSLSPISYKVSGISPDRICKIEFRNAGFHFGDPQDFVHLQIWLFEADDAIEVHLGPHHVSGPEAYETVDGEGPVIGMFNDLDEKYAVLYGDNMQSLEFGIPAFPFAGLLGDWPSGQVYRFTPKLSPVQEPRGTISLKTWPNPCSNWLYISSNQALQESQVRIFDTNGRLQLIQSLDEKAQINVSSLPKGVYNLNVETDDVKYTKTFVKQ
jgi:hypothetical protein